MTTENLTKNAAIDFLSARLKAQRARLHISMDEPEISVTRVDALAREVATVSGYIAILDEIAEALP